MNCRILGPEEVIQKGDKYKYTDENPERWCDFNQSIGLTVREASAWRCSQIVAVRPIPAPDDLTRELAEALEEFCSEYCSIVNSGDCGNWDPEHDNFVIKSRALLAKYKEAIK